MTRFYYILFARKCFTKSISFELIAIRYHVFFGKHHPQKTELNVLEPMLKILENEKAHTAVRSVVLEIVEQLVTTADYGTFDEKDVDERTMPVFIQLDHSVPWDWKLRSVYEPLPAGQLNYGTTLLLGRLDSVLRYMQRHIGRGLRPRDLTIMMRLSDHVTDAQLSSALIKLIVPTVKATVKRSRVPNLEEMLDLYLATVVNLVKCADNPRQYVG